MICDIDSTIPIGVTHLVDRQNTICQQHGGVVTAVNFDKLEEMSLEKFISDIIPTMGERKNELTIIKDPVQQAMYRILNDNVAIYHITEIKDVFFDNFIEKLMSEQQINITPHLTYPLVHYATTKNGEKYITVAIPPKQFTYHASSATIKPFVVWHPPLWLRCKLSPANVPTGITIGVVLDRTDDPKKSSVCHLPLPNCFMDGRICFGGTHFETPNGRTLTEAMAIEMTYQRLFNSEFNMDLVNPSEFTEFQKVCSTLPDYEQFKGELDGSSMKNYTAAIKYEWRDQSSIWKYKYRQMCNGRDFLNL